MTRFLLAIPLLLIVSAAFAQSGRPDPGRSPTEQSPASNVTAVIGERIHRAMNLIGYSLT